MMIDSEDDASEMDKTSIVPSDTLNRRMAEATQTPASVTMLVGPVTSVGKQWMLTASDMIIGRSPTAQVYVDDRSVSKSHARLIVRGNQVQIVDLESTNRTFINDVPIQPLVAQNLTNNDQIKTGNVIFKFLEKGSLEALSHRATFDRGQIDALTGVYNKGALLAAGPEAVKRAQSLRQPMSVVVMDIDHFKKINDTYGHAAGDQILKELGSLIKSRVVRSEDFLARYGGEEFVLLVHNMGLLDAAEVGERLRTAVQSHKFVAEGKLIPVTISIGVTSLTSQVTDWENLFRIADAGLYESKKAGRNRVTAK